MIVLGLVLLIAGFLVMIGISGQPASRCSSPASCSALFGATGRAAGGRRHYW